MPYCFAIVGCGHISQRHAEAILQAGHLAGVFDTNPTKARVLAASFNCEVFSQLHDLLSIAKPDVVSVCSPSGMHPDHTIAALKACCHVVCEKPLAISSDLARSVLELASLSGKKVFVVKQNRFNPPVLAVKELIDKGKLGFIHSFQINCFWNRNKQYYEAASWRGRRAMAGGTLFTQFSHFIDLLNWFLGNIREVKGWRGNFCHADLIDFEDTGAASILMESGAIGTLQYTINAHQQNIEGSISLFGSKGTVKIGGPYLNHLEYFDVEGESTEQWMKQQSSSVASGHFAVYNAIVKALNNPASKTLEAEEALKSIEMIEQIYHASPMLT